MQHLTRSLGNWGCALLCLLATAAAGEIRLVDVTGHEVVLEAPAQRIVSLAPHITETLFAAGAGEKIVGTVASSDYPEAAKAIPQIGGYDRINRESLMAARPDLVLAWESGNGREVIAGLRALGVTVYVSEVRELDEIAGSLRAFATLAGTAEAGHAAANAFDRRLATLRNTYSHRPPVTVFYQIWNSPILTLNGEHLISDVIRLCGGRNSFTDAIALVPKISLESILLRDPDVIVASGMGEEHPEWVDDWRRFPSLRAVQNQQLYFIPPSLLQRHSTRILDGAEQLCGFLEEARAGPAT
ncbi:MAG: cobalamin-binding protein [Haliea sp.]|nr:cobalamin-binding protein [Haliea sp.]|tara:strand:- start:289 stop:1188 length:900 start_codon:yes stop_codon:yes gene_type:complete